LMLDVDGLVLKSLCAPASAVFENMRKDNKCFAGVHEPHSSEKFVRTVNTGLLFIDLECIPPDWHSAFVGTAVKNITKLHSDGGQWPPEQWLYSALFEAFPHLFQVAPTLRRGDTTAKQRVTQGRDVHALLRQHTLVGEGSGRPCSDG